MLIQFWIITITDQGVYNAAFLGLRLILLVVGSSLMTLTTTPLELTDGLEKAMRPLKKTHVPVHEIAMMMSIALRFIPILLEETDKIIKAQQARGADFETGSLMQRAKAMVPILVPLFISAFRRANDLATAMEARCYRGDVGRTRMKEMIYTKEDKIAYGIVFAAVALLIATRFVPTLPQILEMARRCPVSRRIRLLIAYDGTNYAGWQRQKNGIAVQQKIEEAFYSLFAERVTVDASGRTDAGVHAFGQVGAVTLEHSIPVERLALALNQLPSGGYPDPGSKGDRARISPAVSGEAQDLSV